MLCRTVSTCTPAARAIISLVRKSSRLAVDNPGKVLGDHCAGYRTVQGQGDCHSNDLCGESPGKLDAVVDGAFALASIGR